MEQIRVMTKIEIIARTCHEVNKAFCAGLGDFSHLPWESTPENIKASAIDGVQAHLAAGPEGLTPGTSHKAWMDFKRADGWTYGQVKDYEKKTHPSLVAFHQLSEQEQAKDHLFGLIVRAMRDIA